MWSGRSQHRRDKGSLGIVRRSLLKWQKRNIPVKMVDQRTQHQDKVTDPITRFNEEGMCVVGSRLYRQAPSSRGLCKTPSPARHHTPSLSLGWGMLPPQECSPWIHDCLDQHVTSQKTTCICRVSELLTLEGGRREWQVFTGLTMFTWSNFAEPNDLRPQLAALTQADCATQ